MKITKDTLEQLIKEELAIALAEQDGGFRPQPGSGADNESRRQALKAMAHLDRRGGAEILEIARLAIANLDRLSSKMEEATRGAGGQIIDPKTTQLGSGSKTPFKLADHSMFKDYADTIDTTRRKLRQMIAMIEDVTPKTRLYSK